MTIIDEINTAPNSFLEELSENFSWNTSKFENLLQVLLSESEKIKADLTLDRASAKGVWYLSYVLKEITEEDEFETDLNEVYFAKAFGLLDDLCYYYFFGKTPLDANNSLQDRILNLHVTGVAQP